MLTPPNRKLGSRGRIWTFSLPSVFTCPGRSQLCECHCYAKRLEAFRTSVRDRYQQNFQLAEQRDFVSKMIAFLQHRSIEIVRLHVSGDFYLAAYARKWLRIMRKCPDVTFYFYTRSWRRPAIAYVLEQIAGLENVRAWYSCDLETGVPTQVPEGVRLAWMMTEEEDVLPQGDLVFRIHRLRRTVAKRVGLTLVCPTENGATEHRTDCDRCGICWE